jgi:hypothetical protein
MPAGWQSGSHRLEERAEAMSDFLTEADCVPNLNTATIAGKVIKVEPLHGKVPGLTFIVGYMKTWPSGGTQEIPIRCYVSGAARVDQLQWMKPGEVILAHGEITDRNALYCYQVEWLSKPEREPGEGDQYLTGLQRSQAS